MTTPTKEQAAAIDSKAKRRVIIAHPGTGKTFTIVEILNDYLCGRGRSGECITAVSFTRSAAAELKARAEKRVGWHHTRDVLFGTSSALALAIIRECYRGLGLPQAITIYDETDQRDVMTDIIRSQKLGISCKAALEALAASRALQAGEWEAKAIMATRAYEDRLRKAGAVDLEQLLPLAVMALMQDKVALDRWRYRCKYLIVDEYQDTAPAEAALYEVLAPAELVIVGDPNQEIYAFRGTSNRFLLDAGKHPEAETFFLSQSFRSTAAVVDAANNLISHNPDQPEEKLKPAREGGSMNSVFCHSEIQEQWLMRGVSKDMLGRGESIAILCRTNRRLQSARQALKEVGIPIFELALPRAFFRLPEVRAFHACFRALHNPLDEIATKLVCQVWPGLPRPGTDEWFDALKEANLSDVPLLEVVEWSALELVGMPLDVVARAIRGGVVMEYCQSGRTTRADNVDEALERIEDWAMHLTAPTVEDFVDWLQSREIEPAPRPEAAATSVNLGTIHGAKGLEWDHVIILGAEEGHMPHDKSDLAEERRLAYVGITRARTGCALIANIEEAQPSVFCREIQDKEMQEEESS